MSYNLYFKPQKEVKFAKNTEKLAYPFGPKILHFVPLSNIKNEVIKRRL